METGLLRTTQKTEIIEYDPSLHRYRVNGVVVPSVTEILRFSGLSDISWFDEYSAWRGTAVHLACQLDDEHDLDPASVDETVKPYLEAWQKFKAHMCFVSLGNEVMRHRKLNGMPFAGTPDRVGVLGALRCVLDIKSGAVRPETAIQLAAYTHLTDCLHRVAVSLSPDGNYHLKIFPIAERLRDLNRFQGALANWYWRKA